MSTETGLSKLDALIRRSILRHPLIFTTRWDVLHYLYLTIGNGFEWSYGELVEAFADDNTDEQARAEFFRDIDRSDGEFGVDPLARARRQFILDNLDLLVHEQRIDSGRRIGPDDLPHISLDYSHAFNVPDDAEPSFKAGAVEVLGELAQGLYYAERCNQDRGVRAAAVAEYGRLTERPGGAGSAGRRAAAAALRARADELESA